MNKYDVWVRFVTDEMWISGIEVVIVLLNLFSSKVWLLHSLQAGVQDGASDSL